MTRETALSFMQENNIDHYIETSAKSGANVTEIFDTAIKHLYLKSKDRKETEEEFYDQANHKARASFPISRPTFQ